MKILTLNTWTTRGPWEERWKVIYEGLQTLRPDVIGFQEVFKHELAREAMAQLNYKHAVFGPADSGLVIVSRFPIESEAIHQMKTQSPTEGYTRYVIHAKIKVGNQMLALFDTHLSWKLDEGAIR